MELAEHISDDTLSRNQKVIFGLNSEPACSEKRWILCIVARVLLSGGRENSYSWDFILCSLSQTEE